MKQTDIDDIEIGNLMYGHSRGEYVVPREWENVFGDFLERNGFDDYGYRGGESHYENGVFIIRPYYWGDDAIADLPNFVYKPTGFTMVWYKYPLRNAFASQDIKYSEFVKMLKDCERSMKQINAKREMKAILIIDMPICCEDCPCMNWASYEDEILCGALGEELFVNDKEEVIKSKRCPLKPMPEKKPVSYHDDLFGDVEKNFNNIGWNACLEEIEK